jgi:thiol-disulfide isomerase/thioredoxin
MKTKLFIIAFLLSWHLTDAQTLRTLSPQTLRTIELRTTDDQPFSLSLAKPAVFVFLSPECPLSKNYAPVLNSLVKKHPGLSFYGIFPGKAYSAAEIKEFEKEYSISFRLLSDPIMQLTQHFKAKVTPEVFLLNQAGHVLYSGLIDNWAVSLGKKRQVVTHHYLNDAITRFESGKEITVTHTDPVGCLINDI